MASTHEQRHQRAGDQRQVAANRQELHPVEDVGGDRRRLWPIGTYRTSHTRSRRWTCIRAGRGSPGGGMWISSRARNTRLPNTRRIGCAKLPAVYCVAGLASGNPQSQMAGAPNGVRRPAVNDVRWRARRHRR